MTTELATIEQQRAAEAQERAGTLTNLGRVLLSQRAKIEKAEKALKELKKVEDAIESQLLQAMFESGMSGFKSDKLNFTRSELATFTLPPLSQAKERAEVLKWLKRIGAGESVKLTIEAPTLGTLMRQRIEQGKPIHPLLKERQFDKVTLSVRKS